MKKITIMAALLMGGYMANAQVGIGTPEPNKFAELDIVAKNGNRGILIPRIQLAGETVFGMEGAGTEETGVESLLVFHTGSAEMDKGFYYWSDKKWNKIVAGADLNENLETMQDDMSDVRDLLNYIAPTYPGNVDADGNQVTTGEKHSTVVFNAEDNTLSMVTYDGTKYTKTPIEFETMVASAETETFMKVVDATATEGKKFVYFSEKAIQDWLAVEGNAIAGITDDKGVTIDVVGEMKASNALFFADESVKSAIEDISLKADGNVVYKNTAAEGEEENFIIQYYESGVPKSVTFGELVSGAEVNTTILPIENSGKVVGYRYFNEEAVKKMGNTPTTIGDTDITNGAFDIKVVDDVVGSFGEILGSNSKEKKADNSFFKVNELIANYMNTIGNVYYGKIAPADEKSTLYTVDSTGKKTEVNLDFITSVITEEINNSQESLDSTNPTTSTGDSFKGDEVLKFLGTTTIEANSSKTSGVTIAGTNDVKQVLGIELFHGNKFITSSVTDIAIAGKNITFNIGTGNVYYNITNGTKTTYEVVVKYAVAKP